MQEHDKLIEEYQSYKDRLAEYEKQVYLYESKIEEYGRKISESIVALQKLDLTLPSLSKLVDENGEIDLSNENVLRELISDAYSLYQTKIEEGLALMKNE